LSVWPSDQDNIVFGHSLTIGEKNAVMPAAARTRAYSRIGDNIV
jgi:hypothetical protein